MATLEITSFKSTVMGQPGHAAPIPQEPGTKAVVTFTTATQSDAFAAGVRFVRLMPSGTCYVLFGDNPTATVANGQRLVADVEIWRGVRPGQKLSVYDGSS